MNYFAQPSAGHKIITQHIAPHLDFGLDDKIEIKVNRNAKFEAMRKLFDASPPHRRLRNLPSSQSKRTMASPPHRRLRNNR